MRVGAAKKEKTHIKSLKRRLSFLGVVAITSIAIIVITHSVSPVKDNRDIETGHLSDDDKQQLTAITEAFLRSKNQLWIEDDINQIIDADPLSYAYNPLIIDEYEKKSHLRNEVLGDKFPYPKYKKIDVTLRVDTMHSISESDAVLVGKEDVIFYYQKADVDSSVPKSGSRTSKYKFVFTKRDGQWILLSTEWLDRPAQHSGQD